jgi:glycosyltransferase involved in cell wall biosynthesis
MESPLKGLCGVDGANVKMSFPAISIVLPTFNGSRYLEQSVESCLNQSLADWELFIVDDASTDDTPRIAAGFAARDDRIHLIRHEKNRKLPGALNTGFAAARGRYLTWTSDDNLYTPNALETMRDALERHPESDLVYADYATIDEVGNLMERVSAGEPPGLVSGNVVGPCFLYRARVQFELKGYDETLFLAEDYDFWLRVSSRFRLMHLKKSLYHYRLHADSLTSQRQSEIRRAHLSTLARNLPHMRCAGGRVLAIGWCNVAVLAWTEGEVREALRFVVRAAASSLLVTALVLIKVVFMGRRVSYDQLLRLPSWLEQKNS